MTQIDELKKEIEITPYYLEYTELCNRCKKEHKFFMFEIIDKGHGTRLCCLDCYFKQIQIEAKLSQAQADKKLIMEIIKLPKELLTMALDEEKESNRPNQLMTYYRILKQEINARFGE
jgi:hypothetical protein